MTRADAKQYVSRMSQITQRNRLETSLLGALVADAASLGLHWIYTQPRIRRAAGEAPEFHEPKEENYKDVPGFFAHGRKERGDITMYGENVLLLLESLAESGALSAGDYLSRYRAYFGPGGDYVGYADGPTRGTLFNAELMTREIAERIHEMDLDVSEERHNQFAHYISRYALDGDAAYLKKMLRSPFDLYETSDEEYKVLDMVVDEVQTWKRPVGADDTQMPALTKVTPVLLAVPSDEREAALETAVRMTNNNPLAVAYAQGLRKALESVTSEDGVAALGHPGPDRPAKQEPLVEMLNEAFAELPEEQRADIRKALGLLKEDTKAVTLRFGPACDCSMGVPSALHNVVTHSSFTEGVRTNILSCGDSCGRAMVVGPLLGALYGIGGAHGIPEEWIDTTKVSGRTRKLLERV
jgi:ADP-ribosylglycohydrolase